MANPSMKEELKWRDGRIEAYKAKLSDSVDRIAELERIMQRAHIHSRKHTPGYCTVRQSDIDAMGDILSGTEAT